MYCDKYSIHELKHELGVINQKLNSKICCFTGHRPQKLAWRFNENDERCIKMRLQTKQEIEKAILRGYDTFLCGLALGFDIICAELVLELKSKYPYIKLFGAIPCRNQSERWSMAKKERYNKVLLKLNGSRCIYDKYTEGCMQERNQYMINNSSLVIALYNGLGGGTKSTLDYAKSLGKEVIVVKP